MGADISRGVGPLHSGYGAVDLVEMNLACVDCCTCCSGCRRDPTFVLSPTFLSSDPPFRSVAPPAINQLLRQAELVCTEARDSVAFPSCACCGIPSGCLCGRPMAEVARVMKNDLERRWLVGALATLAQYGLSVVVLHWQTHTRNEKGEDQYQEHVALQLFRPLDGMVVLKVTTGAAVPSGSWFSGPRPLPLVTTTTFPPSMDAIALAYGNEALGPAFTGPGVRVREFPGTGEPKA